MGNIISAIVGAINSVFAAIASFLMAIVSGESTALLFSEMIWLSLVGIGSVLMAIVSFLTCGKCGGRRSGRV
jgi:hypothetical protein